MGNTNAIGAIALQLFARKAWHVIRTTTVIEEALAGPGRDEAVEVRNGI